MKLFINGKEFWFDSYQLLEIKLVAERDHEIMGPVRIVVDGDNVEIHGNSEQNEALLMKAPRGVLHFVAANCTAEAKAGTRSNSMTE